MQVQLQSDQGQNKSLGLLMNDWIDVQDGFYRYLAISESGGVSIRIVVAEYLACEVIWKAEQN